MVLQEREVEVELVRIEVETKEEPKVVETEEPKVAKVEVLVDLVLELPVEPVVLEVTAAVPEE